ncbi:MAG: hypothetical protein ACOYM3_13500 [Terrimicrobiaceae bacterium]
MSGKHWKCLLAAFLLLTGCGTAPPVSGLDGRWRNDCVPQAVALTAGLRVEGVDARVLLIKTMRWKHAIVCFSYDSGSNQLWTWDANWKSIRIQSRLNASSCARAWLQATSGARLVSAEWM